MHNTYTNRYNNYGFWVSWGYCWGMCWVCLRCWRFRGSPGQGNHTPIVRPWPLPRPLCRVASPGSLNPTQARERRDKQCPALWSPLQHGSFSFVLLEGLTLRTALLRPVQKPGFYMLCYVFVGFCMVLTGLRMANFRDKNT